MQSHSHGSMQSKIQLCGRNSKIQLTVSSSLRRLLEDKNKWHFVELKQRGRTDEDEVDEERQLVLRHVTTQVSRSTEVGKIGATAFEQRKGKSSEEGHCLVEFTGLPRTEQGEANNGCAWKVDCHWVHSVPTARHWHTKSLQKQSVDLAHVVSKQSKHCCGG